MSLPSDVWQVIANFVPSEERCQLATVCRTTAVAVHNYHQRHYDAVTRTFAEAVRAVKKKHALATLWRGCRKTGNITNDLAIGYNKYANKLKDMVPVPLPVPDNVAEAIHNTYRKFSWWSVLAPLLFSVVLGRCWNSSYLRGGCIKYKRFTKLIKHGIIQIPVCGICYTIPELIVDHRMRYQCGSIVHAKSFYMCSDCADSTFNVMYYGCHCWMVRKETCHKHCKRGTGHCNA